MKSKFMSGGNRGFQLTFENGLTISVQWGLGNYCDRKYEEGKTFGDEAKSEFWIANCAEIAVFTANRGTWAILKGGDNVRGWVTADEVADYITKVKNAGSIEDIHEDTSMWACDDVEGL